MTDKITPGPNRQTFDAALDATNKQYAGALKKLADIPHDTAARLAKALDDAFTIYESGPGHDPDRATEEDLAALIRAELEKEADAIADVVEELHQTHDIHITSVRAAIRRVLCGDVRRAE